MGEKFQALVVEGDIDRRMRLKQAAMMVPAFAPISPVNSLSEATESINSAGANFNIIFLSDRLGSDEANQFIAQAKKVEGAQDAAFVYIVPTQEDLGAIVAQQMVAGMDGFLCEPYSVQALSDIADLAAKIRSERSEERQKAAVKFLMSQIADQITMIAQLKAHGGSILKPMRKLKNLCSSFDDADEAMLEAYQGAAMEMFEQAEVPAPLLEEKYKGVSKRVKQRLEKKVLKELEDKASEEG